MNIKHNKKNLIILSIFIFIFFTLSIILFIKPIRESIISNVKREEPIKEISYEIYSNENDILKMIVTAIDTENGISEVQLPNGNIIKSNNKSKVGIDYKIENDGEYVFTYTSSTGEKISDTLVINDEFKNGLILGIEKIQEVSTEQDYRLTKKYDGQREYEYYYAIGENNLNWTKLSNKEIINVDMYKIIENNWQNEDKTTTLKVKKVNKYGNTVEVKKVINDIQKVENIYNEEEQVIEGESIIACVRDNEIESGNYTLKVNGEEYPAEIYNYDENMNYITDKNLGTSEADGRMLIIKYNGNLNIAENNLITAQTRKKGMFIYVAGELTNNGKISMTARGAKAEGQDVYLWKHDNGVYEYVPAVGAEGGSAVTASVQKSYTNGASDSKTVYGNNGNNGTNRQTGGGGSGDASVTSVFGTVRVSSGAGSSGTSYSGGTGGGSGRAYNSWVQGNAPETRIPGYKGEDNGGAGGTGYTSGAGNPSGGTGGLLIVYANSFDNTNGNIQAKGTNAGGGASGGGSINIFYKKLINEGSIEATGPGNGGDGSIKLLNTNIKLPTLLTITVDEIKEMSFRVNIENENENIEGILYDYYINDIKQIENSTSSSETMEVPKSGKYTIKAIMKYDNLQVPSDEKEVEIEDESASQYIIKMSNKFDKYIYIDSNNGNDTSGDGSKERPYATLDKISDSGIIENGYSYGIILKDGTYNLTTKIFNLNCNKSVNIIGNSENTKLIVGTLYGNNSHGGSRAYNINFYRLIWESKNAICYNPISIDTAMNFYNIVFNITETHGYSYFCAQNNINLYNCISLTSNLILRKNSYQIRLTNCYGSFISGYNTINSDWNYQTNRILNTYTIGFLYSISENKNLWKNVGTGTNPDGSQANLGVYGGTYSWRFTTDIEY